jgi:hypothetical protein
MILPFTIVLVQALIALTDLQPPLLNGTFVNDFFRFSPTRSTLMNLTAARHFKRHSKPSHSFACVNCLVSTVWSVIKVRQIDRAGKACTGSHHYKMQSVELAL